MGIHGNMLFTHMKISIFRPFQKREMTASKTLEAKAKLTNHCNENDDVDNNTNNNNNNNNNNNKNDYSINCAITSNNNHHHHK